MKTTNRRRTGKSDGHCISPHPLTNPPLFEGHITISVPLLNFDPTIVFRLINKGLITANSVDYFNRIFNIDNDTALQLPATTIGITNFTSEIKTGHDLKSSLAMITTISQKCTDLLQKMKNILSELEQSAELFSQSLRIESSIPKSALYNFEIECNLKRDRGMTKIDMQKEFPDYRSVPFDKRPICENHVGYHGDIHLDDWANLTRKLAQNTGFIPNQAVLLSPIPFSKPEDLIFTYYHETFDAALKFGKVLKSLSSFFGAAYIVTEEVCEVGTPI